MHQWKQAIEILPSGWRERVENTSLPSPPEEVRLRHGTPIHILCAGAEVAVGGQAVTAALLQTCLERATGHAVYSQELSEGFVTLAGGHRLGICGTAVVREGRITSFRDISSLNLRIARPVNGCASALVDHLWTHPRSTLLIGPPARGKTTLLRDCIRQLSDRLRWRVCVVDERQEISGLGSLGSRTDILRGVQKARGIELLLRAMNPQWIAVDEITAEADVEAMTRASYCGVRFLATAHADGRDDLQKRPIYRKMLSAGVFENLVTILPDRTLKTERLECNA